MFSSVVGSIGLLKRLGAIVGGDNSPIWPQLDPDDAAVR
jgi:hypothetical protein